MSTASSKSKPDLSAFRSDRVRFEDIDDTVTGALTAMSIKSGNSGDVLVLELDVGGEDRQVWCPTMLARAVADADPEIGDVLTITLTGLRNTGRPSPLKEFDLKVEPGGGETGDPF